MICPATGLLIGGQSQPSASHILGDENEVVEYRSARLPQAQSIYQERAAPAGQAVRDESRTLGTLFGLAGKAGQLAHRCYVCQKPSQSPQEFGIGAVTTGEQNGFGGGRGMPELADRLHCAFGVSFE